MESLIPNEVYRYTPKGDKIFIGSGHSIIRFIFYKVDFTDYEKAKILEFYSFLSSKSYKIPENYPEEEILRTILGCKFNFKKTYEAILSSIAWKTQNMPRGISSLYHKCEDLLNSGSIYIHGRDHRYRPLIILNTIKLDLDHYSSEDYCSLLCFILQYCIENLMSPGRVENWIIITDLNNQSLSSLPMHELRSIIKVLQDNFRCRMIVNYVLNAPRSLKFIWSIVSGFIEAHTVNKIRIIRGGKAEDIKKHFALHQVEEKYGGTAPNVSDKFWPPVLPPGPFEAEGEVSGAHLEPLLAEKQEEKTVVGDSKDELSQEEFYSLSSSNYYSIHDERHSTITKGLNDCSFSSQNLEHLNLCSHHQSLKEDKKDTSSVDLYSPENEDENNEPIIIEKKDDSNQEVFYSLASSAYYTATHERSSTTEKPVKRGSNISSSLHDSSNFGIGTSPLLENRSSKKKCCGKCQII